MKNSGRSHSYHEYGSSKKLIARLEEERRKTRLLFDQIEQSNRTMRRNYARSINSLSEGKLVLAAAEDIDLILGEPISPQYELFGAEDLSRCRKIATMVLKANFSLQTPRGRTIMAIGEAMTNAAKHAGGGNFGFYRKGDRFQFRIEDFGAGISSGSVPQAALTPGFSTVGTAGLGFSIMLEQCNRLYLSSRPGKTILVLEFRL